MSTPTRRTFLGTAATVPLLVPAVHASGGDETLRVGLIGCGSRGTGAASQALRADRYVKLVAMGDVFDDRLKSSLDFLRKDEKIADKVDVKPDKCFIGFDAYQKVIDSGVDVVLLTTPPHFRPMHIEAAVKAGKHVFAEKPIAVDAPGVRSVLETCKIAKKKNLSVVSGLCLRYDNGFKETVRRLHQDEVGEILTLQATDLRGSNWAKPRLPGMSDMQYQMRNWYNFTWLSGDFNVEQHVHFLDVCAWVMKDQYPVRAVGLGGQQTRTKPEHGVIFDHFSIVYEYENGARLFSNCRQQNGCHKHISAEVTGTKGRCMLSERRKGLWIKSSKDWVYTGKANDMYQTEHDELFASIRNGKPINNGEYMCKSTLLAIMGRMAGYTGQMITWDMAMKSTEDLRPKKYTWDATPPASSVAIPGQTKFR